MKFNLTVNTKEKDLIQDYNDFKSPFNHYKLLEIQEKIIEKYYKFVDSEKNIENKQLFLSGGMVSLITSLPYIEKSYAILSAKLMKIDLKGEDEISKFLLKKISIRKISGKNFLRLKPRKIPKLNKLISIYRTLKYNPIKSHLKLINNDKQSFTISSLILDYFYKKKLTVNFVFPQNYLNYPEFNRKIINNEKVNELAEKFYNAVFYIKDLENPQLKRLIIDDLKYYFKYTKFQFDILRKKNPPSVIYTGTGGMFTNRVIGLWAMNKGSAVIRFAHGSSASFFYKSDYPSKIIELKPSSTFVFPTQKFHDFIIKIRKWDKNSVGCQLDYSKGHKDFLIKTKKNSGRKKKILYVGAHIRNHTQTLSPNIFDTIYLDWQIFLLKTLRKIDKDIQSIIHPQSYLPRENNPINSFNSNLNFEDVFDNFDVLIFDYFKSTTFSKSLCTNKHIIFVDVGGNSMINGFKKKIKERCNFILPYLDKNNRLRIDKDSLEDSIYRRRNFNIDFFKELYCG